MKKTFKLQDLDCANCAAKIENAVKNLVGVTNVKVNFLSQKMEFEAPDDKYESIFNEAKKIIKKIKLDVTVNY